MWFNIAYKGPLTRNFCSKAKKRKRRIVHFILFPFYSIFTKIAFYLAYCALWKATQHINSLNPSKSSNIRYQKIFCISNRAILHNRYHFLQFGSDQFDAEKCDIVVLGFEDLRKNIACQNSTVGDRKMPHQYQHSKFHDQHSSSLPEHPENASVYLQ